MIYLKLLRQTFFKKVNTDFFSQFGEDRVLMEILKKKMNKGFYVDVGCYHPKKHSNTYLLNKKGWKGINIDIEKKKIRVFEMARPNDINITRLDSSKAKKILGWSASVDLKELVKIMTNEEILRNGE